jgi:phosphatidylserine/phosphatidylglycerophosphate/cardiolipin synthase-like enzyme
MIHETIISSPAGSWNHGKIVAVGGKTMMTEGMNPWSEYTSDKQPIIDLAIKITGDATISAHT